jgi:hypothetical protein
MTNLQEIKLTIYDLNFSMYQALTIMQALENNQKLYTKLKSFSVYHEDRSIYYHNVQHARYTQSLTAIINNNLQLDTVNIWNFPDSAALLNNIHNSNIKHLTFIDCVIYNISDKLPLYKFPLLESLKFIHCNITPTECLLIADYINQYGKNLKQLDLTNNRCQNEGFLTILKAIRNIQLEDLNFTNNNIVYNESFYSVMSDAFKYLTRLSLSCAIIDIKSMEVILQTLLHYNRINTLSLANCLINLDGIQLIANFIQYNTSLRYLHLDDNDIGDDGAVILAKSLKHSSLISIFMGDSNIKYDGMMALANGIKDNKTIKKLYVYGEWHESYKHIYKILKYNKSLLYNMVGSMKDNFTIKKNNAKIRQTNLIQIALNQGDSWYTLKSNIQWYYND